MNGIRSLTSTAWSYDYNNKKTGSQQGFEVVESDKPYVNANDDEKFLGFVVIFTSTISSYSMKAEYAEDYSKENPIIRVEFQTENGTVEEHYININNVNPNNATEIEMFALCNYADANGMGTGDPFGSWNTLRYYQINASDNGYFEMSNGTENFAKSKQDWASMVTRMRADYMGAGIYKQVLDGNKLLQLFKKHT